jgi:glycogen synthase
VEALAGLPPDTSLRVVGWGDRAHLGALERLAERRGLAERVAFERAGRHELREVYAAADAVLFPVRWEEPWGLVPLEAMAVGRPVIASGRGGSGEYLRDGHNSLLFDRDDGPGPLAAAVERLAAEPALRERLRSGGFETTGRLSEQAFNETVERELERARSGLR